MRTEKITGAFSVKSPPSNNNDQFVQSSLYSAAIIAKSTKGIFPIIDGYEEAIMTKRP